MKEENIKRGKDMLEREAKRRGYNLSELLSTAGLNYIMNRYTLSSIDDLYASVGFGGLTTNQIIVKLIDYFKRDLLSKTRLRKSKPPRRREKVRRETASLSGATTTFWSGCRTVAIPCRAIKSSDTFRAGAAFRCTASIVPTSKIWNPKGLSRQNGTT